MGNPSQNCRVLLATWDHTMLLSTLTLASKAGTRFIYLGGMEG